jgi:hypothetical protein
MKLKELNKEGDLFLTNKGVEHDYLTVYEMFFAPIREDLVNIFEVGYWYGGSCELWRRYFPNAKIKAIDVRHPKDRNGSPYVTKFIPAKDNVHLSMRSVQRLTPLDFRFFIPDIAIDDGSHVLDDQILFTKLMLTVMKPGGLLFIEDIQNLDVARPAFEKLRHGFEIFDLREENKPDNVLILFRI